MIKIIKSINGSKTHKVHKWHYQLLLKNALCYHPIDVHLLANNPFKKISYSAYRILGKYNSSFQENTFLNTSFNNNYFIIHLNFQTIDKMQRSITGQNSDQIFSVYIHLGRLTTLTLQERSDFS